MRIGGVCVCRFGGGLAAAAPRSAGWAPLDFAAAPRPTTAPPITSSTDTDPSSSAGNRGWSGLAGVERRPVLQSAQLQSAASDMRGELFFDASFVIVKKFYTLQGGGSQQISAKIFFRRKKRGAKKFSRAETSEQYKQFQRGGRISAPPPPLWALKMPYFRAFPHSTNP